MNQTIHNLLTGQLASWETARNNYAALSGVRVKELNVNGILYKVQFNPARIVSSGAKVDAKSILERKCFLCPANLPPVQKGIPFGGHYNILVNPFPIFPRHLTVPELAHTPQRIATRFTDMLELAEALTGEERESVRRALAFRTGERPDLDQDGELLFRWCGRLRKG